MNGDDHLDSLRGRDSTTDAAGSGGFGRRRFLVAASATALAIGGVGTATGRRVAREDARWSMYRRDPTNSGAIASATAPNALADRWELTSLALRRYYPSLPAVVGDTAYVVTGVGRDEQALTARSTADGSERWSVRFESDGDRSLGSPAVAGGRVFVSRDRLHAFAAGDGSRLGTFETSGVPSDPTVFDGTVYVEAADAVHAVRTADGTERWRYDLSGGRPSVPGFPPVVTDDGVFVHADGTTLALDRADGDPRWRSSGGLADGALSVNDGTIVVPASYGGVDTGGVYALDATDGARRWEHRFPGNVSTVAVAHGRAYFVSGGIDDDDWPNGMYACDLGSGDRRWHDETVGAVTEPNPDPIVVGDAVLAGDVVGRLFAFDAASGEVRWQQEFDAGGRIYPVSTADLTVVTSAPNDAQDDDDGAVYATEHVYDEGDVDARISEVRVDDGPFGRGEVVRGEVTVENTGDADHEFFVGFSVVGPDGDAYTNGGTTGDPAAIDAGETGTVTVEWTVEDDAPEGTYEAHVAVWEERDRNALETMLDDRRVDGAFTVE